MVAGRPRNTPETIADRTARIEELRRRRVKLNITGKQMAYALNTSPCTVRHFEGLDTTRFGERFIQRYEEALREWVANIRQLADGWGY
jgi:transcriptional regulator with XRE-family HTH domain